MKTTKIGDVFNNKQGEMTDRRKTPRYDSEQSGEIQLMIIAIDPSNLMENRSVIFQFAKKYEGMMAYHVLAATAKNVHSACVGDLVRFHLVK
jgi:hypothetical protein